ncbi:hypothetical protein FOZ63_019128, partial [Perkinsus olseni]
KSLSNDPSELTAPRMMCVKCGIIWHSKCRDRWLKKTAASSPDGKRDKLGDWLWDDKFIMCDQCAAEQYKVAFNASRRCLACNNTIIDGTAPKKTCSSKISCVLCGGKWHSKCIPEFRDLSAISIPDYICCQCLAHTPMEGLGGQHSSADKSPTTAASDTEMARSLASELVSMRHRHATCAERSRMLDALAGRHNSGLLKKLPKHLEPALQQTMALAGASVGSTATGSTPPVIGADSEDWLVRTMGQDIFLPRRGVKVPGQVSPTVSTPQDALIAQRLLAARDILQWIDTQDLSPDGAGSSGSADGSPLDSSPNLVRPDVAEEPRALCQRSWWLHQGVDPGLLLLRIIHKTLTALGKGYIGAFSPARYPVTGMVIPKNSVSIPVWDERRCSLCGTPSDTLSMGRLIPWLDGHWVHALCAQFTVKGLTVTFPGLLPTDLTASPVEQPRREPESGATSAHALPQYARLSRYVSCRVDVVDYPTSLAGSAKHTCPLCRGTGAYVSCLCGRHHYHLPCLLTAEGGPAMDLALRVVYCGAIVACRAPASGRSNQKAPYASELVSQLHRCAVTLIPVLPPDQEELFNDECAAIALGPPPHLQKVLPALTPSACILATLGLLHPFQVPRFRMDDGLPICENSAVRSGGLSIVRLGTIDSRNQLEQPNGFVVIRLFWSVEPTRRRSAYVCTIDYDGNGDRVVTVRIATGGVVAVADSVDAAWRQLVEQLSLERRQQAFRDFTAQWFFGLMSPVVVAHLREARRAFAGRKIMQEASLWMDHPGARAQLLTGLLGPGNDSCGPVESVKFKSGWEQPAQPDMRELGVVRTRERGISPLLIGQRSAHYKFLLDPSNCPVESSTANNQTTGEYNQAMKSARTRTHWPEGSSSSPTLTALYRIRAQTDDGEVLEVKRSRIHNYGLFAKVRFAKGDMVVEYAGEIVRHSVADCRERYYEEEMLMGQCCYMFRLDEHYVVDATLRGNTARFINHSCNPNCVCRVVEDPVPLASEDDTSFRGVVRASHKKHIMIVAKNDIGAGEEITYDYQFAVESEKLACKCGAPNCLGRLN